MPFDSKPHAELLLEAALRYAEQYGWRVFPCHGKVPAVPHGCNDATTDPQTIRSWWEGAYRGCNVAIATGQASDLWALDVDPDDDGDASLNSLERDYGPLPETVRQLTGRDGWHYLFRLNGTPIRNSVGKVGGIKPGLDTRAEGGYIIAPPSIHPNTGKAYQWEVDLGPEDIEPAEAPAWLETLAARPERPERIVAEARRRLPEEGPASPYGQKALDAECRAIREAADGAQETTLNNAAFGIGSLVAGGELDEDHAFKALCEAGNAMPSHDRRKPWKPRTIENKLLRAMADGGRTPRNAPKPPSSEPAPDAEGGRPHQAPPAAQRSIRAIPVPKLSEVAIPPRRFAVGRRLQYGEVSLGGSPGGVGKTSLVIVEALAWVTGRPLTGEAIRPRGNAWIVTAEESTEEMYRRVLAACRHFGIDPDSLEGRLFITSTRDGGAFRVARIDENRKLVETEAPDDVIAEMRENDIHYLAVDPFVTTHEASEDDNGAMDRVARVFNRIARQADAAVNLLHHVVKSEDAEAHVGNLARLRGAGGIVNAVRHAYTIASLNEKTAERYGLTPDEAVRVMRLDSGLKGNYVLKPTEPLWFWRESVTLDNATDEDEADEVGVLRPFNMAELQAERCRIKEVAREPERNAIAQQIADVMTEDRVLVSALQTQLKDVIEGKETKRREVILDAIPFAPGHRAVRIRGEPGRVYLSRTRPHSTAPVEVFREVDP